MRKILFIATILLCAVTQTWATDYNVGTDSDLRAAIQHNNANMIAFGATFMKLPDVLRRIEIFLKTPFEGGRHERRVKEISFCLCHF